MNLEDRLNESFNDILRTAGYFFEVINSNRKQSNLITGPNSQIVPAQITTSFTKNIGQFESILDETATKLDDAVWCIEQIVENKKRQDELKIKEELEKQKLAEDERVRQEKEAVAKKKKAQEEEERLAKEKLEKEQQNDKKLDADGSDFTTNFDGNLDMGKELGFDIPNPSDILSSISYKGGEPSGIETKDSNKLDNMDLDANLGPGMVDDLGMDLLGQNFDGGMGDNLEEEFDVDNFLNQFGNGD